MLQRSQNSDGLVLLVHLGLWLLLILSVLGLRHGGVHYDETGGGVPASVTPIPTGQLGSLFASGSIAPSLLLTNDLELFATRHFMPPLVQDVSRRMDLTYRGYYEVASGPRHALVLVGNSLSNYVVGTGLMADLVVSEVFADRLVLTNGSGETNEVHLNRRQPVAIPDQ